MVNDEAVNPLYQRYTRHLLRWLRQQHPDAIAYGNMHPAGHDNTLAYGTVQRYFDEFAAMVEPDVLMTDIYPLGDPKVEVFAHTLGHPVGETKLFPSDRSGKDDGTEPRHAVLELYPVF